MAKIGPPIRMAAAAMAMLGAPTRVAALAMAMTEPPTPSAVLTIAMLRPATPSAALVMAMPAFATPSTTAAMAGAALPRLPHAAVRSVHRAAAERREGGAARPLVVDSGLPRATTGCRWQHGPDQGGRDEVPLPGLR